ncbi:PREDICTED: protein NUCLEAR FUSION DEFECTIVE 4-like [Fragaria vesca subsp. vesca]|uniref:protein NUCLEAR FUSION DEFECTIVE 4-like n=1 Tax=Fragaria vesca subsp. vesca TaxID=101020 RepID=UPI0002C34262|nr:PREDICTED: protein NUCLEAR FUSION DEFECTIVE 4-like [Fragaria vesca subsp. vesca]
MRPRRDHSVSSSTSSSSSYKPFSISSDTKPSPSSSSSQQKALRRVSYYKLAVLVFMAGQSRKWMILVATIWIQAFTGTNFDFSSYSSVLKSVLGISQVQLNYLATASDLGKVFGWSSGLALMYFPLWVVLFIAAFMGFVGYGLQWLVIRQIIVLPYFVMFLLCLLAGCSICWFNTVCFVLCIRNFPANQPLAISLTVSFNGVSAALYNLAADAIDSSSTTIYLILNAVIPLITSVAALIPILRQPSLDPLPPDGVRRDSVIFLFLNILAVLTGIYLLLFGSSSFDTATARVFLAGAIFLLIFPLCIPGIVYARDWFRRAVHSNIRIEGSGFILVDVDDLELHKELLTREPSINGNGSLSHLLVYNGASAQSLSFRNKSMECTGCCGTLVGKDQLAMLGEEHSARLLVRRLDFWLYYIAYFCGGTIGLVYSNNLGQIAQSLGQSSNTTTLVTLYSSFSFFGRLLSAVPDYIRAKFYFARTGWLTIALLPTPVAFILLAASSGTMALHAGTALIGLSSGFIFAAAVSITSELFGPNSVGVNHNILITNIPLGSLVYGFLAAIVYDANVSTGLSIVTSDTIVCMGRNCYFLTFVWWACISVLGLASSVLLFFRTRHAYDHFEHNRSTQLY